MVFTIGVKKTKNSDQGLSLPIPLLPPPPSTKVSRNSSSSDTDDNDPLAIFQSKPILNNNFSDKSGTNLITDWEETETKTEQRVCLIIVYVYPRSPDRNVVMSMLFIYSK